MRWLKCCGVVLFFMLINTVSYAQGEGKKKGDHSKEMQLSNHMKNYGVLRYERKVPDCVFIHENTADPGIVCVFKKKSEMSKPANPVRKTKDEQFSDEEAWRMAKRDSEYKSDTKTYK